MRLESWILGLALISWTPQSPAPQEPIPFPLSDSASAVNLGELLVGAWQLERIESAQMPLSPGDVVGYALFLDGYMALEIHGVSRVGLEYSEGQFFQSGFHRYVLDGLGGLETSSLIGVTNLTEDETIIFQSPGDRRRFRASISEERLTLVRSDGTTFRFMKLGKLPFPGQAEQVDAFGRPVKPPGGTPPEQKRE